MLKKLAQIFLVLAVAAVVMVQCTKDEKVKQPELVRINVVHVVTPAERTVHDIARKYIDLHKGPNDYARFIFAIKHINGMLDTPRTLQAGDRIIIPLLVHQ